jgi:hypothetical protein
VVSAFTPTIIVILNLRFVQNVLELLLIMMVVLLQLPALNVLTATLHHAL